MNVKISCEELFKQYKKTRLFNSYIKCISLNEEFTISESILDKDKDKKQNMVCHFTSFCVRRFICKDTKYGPEYYASKHKLNISETTKENKTYQNINKTCHLELTDHIIK